MSKHLLSARSVPSSLFQAQLCAAALLRAKAGSRLRWLCSRRRRVKAVTGVDRLGEAQVLALSQLRGAALPVDRPTVKQAMSGRSQTCSGTN